MNQTFTKLMQPNNYNSFAGSWGQSEAKVKIIPVQDK